MTDANDPEWSRLTAWFLAALAAGKLPTAPYRIDQATEIVDPARSHQWLRERIAEGAVGQVRGAVRARLRKLWRKFGGEWQGVGAVAGTETGKTKEQAR